jgi:ferredoxin-like protein FixX
MEITLTLEDKRKLVSIAESTKDWLRVNIERCTGCGNCVIACEMNLWSIKEGKARLLKDYRKWCMECGGCYISCPADAIEFDFPPGGEGVAFKYG